MRLSPFSSTLGHALLGAAVLWMALPPLGRWLWPLAWVAPVWWILLIRPEQLAGRRPYRALALAGFLFWMAALHWLRLPHWATSFGWIALSLYFAFYLPVFVGLSRVAVHRLRLPVILAAPIVWTGLELARGHLLTGMTMASLGHTQYRWIELIQLSDLAGAYGVSFVVMLVAACLGRALPCDGRPRVFWPLAPALAVLAAVIGYGYWRTSGQYTLPGARVALIQESIDAEIKVEDEMREEIFWRYFALSKKALDKYENVDLLVWPETMYCSPLYTFDRGVPPPEDYDAAKMPFAQWLELAAAGSRAGISETARRLESAMILGVDRQHFGSDGTRRFFNSAVYVGQNGELLGDYDKIHRVMFGEYVPFAEYFPWLHRLTPLSVSVTPGSSPAAFELAEVTFSPNICFETVLPHVIRRQVNRLRARGTEPDVLVNLTNDGWFRGSSELDMHLVCGVFRAVECRKPLLIAANTGFSAWIDGDGRILQRGPRRAAGMILAEVCRDRRHSWYLRHGDWPAGICLAACLMFAAVGTWQRIRQRQ